MQQQFEESLGREIADIIKTQISPWANAYHQLEKRITEIEARKPEKGERGESGQSGRDGIDGKSIDVDAMVATIVPLLEQKIEKLFTDYPKPIDGKDGKDADPNQVAAQVIKSINQLPWPKDGKDGVGLAGAIIDRDGHLIITKTDGGTHNLGIVVGRDGTQGPAGNDGAAGRDGFGFDDMEPIDEPLRFGCRFIRGKDVKEFWWNKTTLADFDHEVFREGNVYPRGAVVSSDGSLFICKQETKQRPGIGKAWRLAVKRGKDGKDGKDGARGERGPAGQNAAVY